MPDRCHPAGLVRHFRRSRSRTGLEGDGRGLGKAGARGDRLIALFDPPFDAGSLQPGYIKGYVPGIRENGGQYTHAATWVVWATALLGDGDRAMKLWNLLSPISHGTTKDQVARYKVEPYAVSADVYGAPPHTGRGGWTWYTGSRLDVPSCARGDFRVPPSRSVPHVPALCSGKLVGLRNHLSARSCKYEIRFDNSSGIGRGVRSVMMDEVLLPNGNVPLRDEDLTHDVRVIIGQ